MNETKPNGRLLSERLAWFCLAKIRQAVRLAKRNFVFVQAICAFCLWKLRTDIPFADVRRCWWEVEGRDNQRPFAEVMQAAADDVVKFFQVLSWFFSNVFQNLFGVNFGFDFFWGVNLLNDSVFVHQISGAERADGASAASHFFAPTA